MKKIFLITFILLITNVFSQNKEKNIEKIKQLRIAFISQKLDLTTAEAEKFWPVFNTFDDKQTELRKQKKIIMNKISDDKIAISESEMTKILSDSENNESALQNNRKQFVKELQGVIPVKKILLLKQLEEEFKSQLLKQFKNRKKGKIEE
jgi:Rps23 Pro-64 3,4-dihydroxylase Tpa1-like proline 4-hydroxylase